MSNVVSLDERRPHLAGFAKCLNCGHEWTFVAPIGTTVFACPRCGLERGVNQGVCVPPVAQACIDCGGQVFWLCPAGPMCLSCGTTMPGWRGPSPVVPVA